MERSEIDKIVCAVVAGLNHFPAPEQKKQQTPPPAVMQPNPGAIPVEMSARHIHLSREHMLSLFGTDVLPQKKPISQPGQYLSELRVRLIGPKGTIDNVAVLGPLRKETQAEVSATDARQLGIQAPVRLSGDLSGAALVHIQAGKNIISCPCAIIAKRHVHMTPEDAAHFQVKDGQVASLRVMGNRLLILEDVVLRVTQASALALHIDTDEANAAGAWESTICHIVGTSDAPASCSHDTANAPKADVPASIGMSVQGKLISERDVLELSKKGEKTLRMGKGQLITPLARDAIKARGMTLLEEERN